MKLKKEISLTSFLQKVKDCQGEVTFQTGEGDCLNLKSVLTGYIFVALMMSPEVLEEGLITCEEKEDYDILNEYLVP